MSPIDIALYLQSACVIKRIFITCCRKCYIQQERIEKKIKSFHNGYSDLGYPILKFSALLT